MRLRTLKWVPIFCKLRWGLKDFTSFKKSLPVHFMPTVSKIIQMSLSQENAILPTKVQFLNESGLLIERETTSATLKA